MKRIAIILVSMAISANALIAQTDVNTGNIEIKGSLFDFGSAEPLYPANVQIYSLPDTVYVNGVSSDEKGNFSMKGLGAGQYLLRATFMGYEKTEKDFTLRSGSRTTDLGKITLKADAIYLSEAVVSAALAKVQMINDTVVFNSEAYRLPEGASLEELVRKLPGVEVSSDGTIKVNGKTVSRILVNGKEFFDNDQSVAMQNLTADMIEKIKAYDKQSDMARMTGIDDGEEQTVLDLVVKKGMAQGWFGNVDVGYGQPLQDNEFDIRDLYTTRLTLNRFNEDKQFTIIASTGNISGGGVGGFGGMRGMGGMGGRGGVTKTTTTGINFARNIGPEITSSSYQYEIGGSVNYSHSSSESRSKTASESFYASGIRSYSNRTSESGSLSNSINGQLRFEWNADPMTSLIFTPSFTYSRSNNESENISATFNRDPYIYATNPLDTSTVIFDNLENYLDSLNDAMRNSQLSRSLGKSTSMSTSGNIQFVKRLNTEGRNLSFRGSYSFSNSESNNNSRNDQVTKNAFTNSLDTTLFNRYNNNPNSSTNLNAQLTYTEPIAASTYLQFSYQFTYRRSNSDRATYSFTDLPSWGNPDWIMPDDSTLKASLDKRLSQVATYDNYDHNIAVQIRKTSDKYNVNLGFTVLPQYSDMQYNYLGHDIDTSRLVFNWTPTVNFRYQWTRQEQINITYRGRSSQPQMNDLLDITDDSNPLSISMGNPGLKPTFSNTMSINYQKFDPVNLGSIMMGVNFNNTLRNITRQTLLNDTTFGTTTKPVNMEGFWSNWQVSGNLNINRALPDQRFTINSGTNVSFNHQEGYAQVSGGLSQLRTTLTTTLSENLSASFRDDWIEVSLQGRINYSHSTNDLQPDRNMDTYNFNYGPSGTATLPWRNIRLATDMMMQSRRGYSSSDMNTDELIWNASASFSFLKGNRGTLSLSVYDILQQRSNVNRTMTATMRSDTYSNSINSYFMVNFIYRLSMFGSREARQGMRSGGYGGSFSGGGMGGSMGGGGMRGGG
ncbi:MAG TPA: outer membrane beta-barrel protein, partial [Bacteroidaceae bacterium]|nr:outer membrane beta-barrel protein [Bacteroidaceae bacterium]